MRRSYAWNFIPLRQRERKTVRRRIGSFLIRLTFVLAMLGLIVLVRTYLM